MVVDPSGLLSGTPAETETPRVTSCLYAFLTSSCVTEKCPWWPTSFLSKLLIKLLPLGLSSFWMASQGLQQWSSGARIGVSTSWQDYTMVAQALFLNLFVIVILFLIFVGEANRGEARKRRKTRRESLHLGVGSKLPPRVSLTLSGFTLPGVSVLMGLAHCTKGDLMIAVEMLSFAIPLQNHWVLQGAHMDGNTTLYNATSGSCMENNTSCYNDTSQVPMSQSQFLPALYQSMFWSGFVAYVLSVLAFLTATLSKPVVASWELRQMMTDALDARVAQQAEATREGDARADEVVLPLVSPHHPAPHDDAGSAMPSSPGRDMAAPLPGPPLPAPNSPRSASRPPLTDQATLSAASSAPEDTVALRVPTPPLATAPPPADPSLLPHPIVSPAGAPGQEQAVAQQAKATREGDALDGRAAQQAEDVGLDVDAGQEQAQQADALGGRAARKAEDKGVDVDAGQEQAVAQQAEGMREADALDERAAQQAEFWKKMCTQIQKADQELSVLWDWKQGGLLWCAAFAGCGILFGFALFCHIASGSTSLLSMDGANLAYFLIGALVALALGLVLASTTLCEPNEGHEALHDKAVKLGDDVRPVGQDAQFEHLRFLHLVRVKPLGAKLFTITFTEGKVLRIFAKIGFGIPAAITVLQHFYEKLQHRIDHIH